MNKNDWNGIVDWKICWSRSNNKLLYGAEAKERQLKIVYKEFYIYFIMIIFDIDIREVDFIHFSLIKEKEEGQ